MITNQGYTPSRYQSFSVSMAAGGSNQAFLIRGASAAMCPYGTQKQFYSNTFCFSLLQYMHTSRIITGR